MTSVVAADVVFVAFEGLGRQKVGHSAMSRRWGGIWPKVDEIDDFGMR